MATLCFAATLAMLPCVTWAQAKPEALLDLAQNELHRGSESAKATLDQIAKIESTLSQPLKFRYLRLLADFYAFRDMGVEEVATSHRALPYAANPDQRASLLYYLADGYSRQGEYESALRATNEGVLLLPKLTELDAKIETLQSAISLFESLHAYDEAGQFAQRMIELPTEGNIKPVCAGMADQVEIAFLQNNSSSVQALLPQAVKTCDGGSFQILVLNMRALAAIDRLRADSDAKVLHDGLALLDELTKASTRSEYNTQLSEAIARFYLANHQPTMAEPYANRAWQWAREGNSIQLRLQTSETMAALLRAQGKLAQALDYLDVGRALREKLLEERSRKDLAYERVKFEQQDQANQIKLLTQINRLLTTERDLQRRNQHSLWLVLLLAFTLLCGALAWLTQTRHQRNHYRASAQTDSLTGICNRSHFVAGALTAFKDARRSVAVVLFDMDHFKQINDTYSHATGDWVLKTVSATVSDCLRAHDLFGRLGGEEFAICLPNTEASEAAVLAERCRSAIEAIDSTACGQQFVVTASFGVAMRSSLGNAGFEETLAAADHALYRAKDLGRNRVALHQTNINSDERQRIA